MVPRRPPQRRLQLHRPAPELGSPQQGRHHLGRGAGGLAGLYLLGLVSGGLPLCQRAEKPGGEKGRPGNDLSADDSRTAHCDAGLRPDRRGAQRHLWRVQRRIHPRSPGGFPIQGADYRRRGLSPRRHCPAETERRRRPGGQYPGGKSSGRPPHRPGRGADDRRAGCVVARPGSRPAADLRSGADGQRGYALYALHQRHYRQAQGHRPHHRRLSDRRLCHHQVDFRPERGGCLLVYRRYWLGHRPQLHCLWAAGERGHFGDV